LKLSKNGDLGFGQVDGLRFTANQEYLFVTTDKHLKKYLAGRPKLLKTWLNFLRLVNFYLAITAESAVTYFAEIPVKSPNEKSYVRAFLGLTAQDIGPFIPKDIFVSLRREIEYSQSSRQRQLRSQKFRSVETSGRSLPRRRQTQMSFIDPPA